MGDEKVRVEEVHVTGDSLLSSIKELVREGNVRRISVRNQEGVTLLEIPLLLGVAGAALLPVWAAVGALAALVVKCSIVIERVEGPGDGPAEPPAA